MKNLLSITTVFFFLLMVMAIMSVILISDVKANIKENITQDKSVQVLKLDSEYEIKAEKIEIDGEEDQWIYEINPTFYIKYLSTVDKGFNVIPVVQYKGITSKVLINGEEKILIDKQEIEIEVKLDGTITSFAKPTLYVADQFSNSLNENEKVIIETSNGGIFSVMLKDVCNERRKTVFELECETFKKNVVLREFEFCEEKNLFAECKQENEICKGKILITLVDRDECNDKLKGVKQVDITAVGGTTFEFKDKMIVSFWKDIECVTGMFGKISENDNYVNFAELSARCSAEGIVGRAEIPIQILKQ